MDLVGVLTPTSTGWSWTWTLPSGASFSPSSHSSDANPVVEFGTSGPQSVTLDAISGNGSCAARVTTTVTAP